MANILFPGRPDYTGPVTGLFGLLHHDTLTESSHDVMERVSYVKEHKSRHEVEIRLHDMIYLGNCPAASKCDSLNTDYKAKRASLDADYKAKCASLYADYEAKCAPLNADYEAKRNSLDADYQAKRDSLNAKILAYIKTHIPDCAWNGHELIFG